MLCPSRTFCSDNGRVYMFTHGSRCTHYSYCTRCTWCTCWRVVRVVAITDGCKVKGYTIWSLLDNFEWNLGYSQKFGLHKVDFSDPKRPRTPKLSADWFRKLISGNRIPWIAKVDNHFTSIRSDQCHTYESACSRSQLLLPLQCYIILRYFTHILQLGFLLYGSILLIC